MAVGGTGYKPGAPISFGARQAIIVRNNESRKALPPEFANANVITVVESKGLSQITLTNNPTITLIGGRIQSSSLLSFFISRLSSFLFPSLLSSLTFL